MVPASILPNGNGGFIITPKKPKLEGHSTDVAKMLNIHRSSLTHILKCPLAQKLILWRWNSERRGKRIFNLASVAAYRQAMEDPEVGG